MNKQWLIIGAVVAVLFASYLWNRNKEVVQEENPIVEEIITLDDGTVVKKTGEMIEEISQEEQQQKKDEIDAKVMDEVPVDMMAGQGLEGSGSFQKKFVDGVYYQKVKVSDLEPLDKGSYYEVWLQKGDQKLSIGRLEMMGGTGELYYQAKIDRSDYTKILVSKEIEDGNPEIGRIVLESSTE